MIEIVSDKTSINFASILIFEGSKLNQRDEVTSCFSSIIINSQHLTVSYRLQSRGLILTTGRRLPYLEADVGSTQPMACSSSICIILHIIISLIELLLNI